jgi:hypothetical protein
MCVLISARAQPDFQARRIFKMESNDQYSNKAQTGTTGESVGEAFDNLNDAHTVKPGEPIQAPPAQDGGLTPPSDLTESPNSGTPAGNEAANLEGGAKD